MKLNRLRLKNKVIAPSSKSHLERLLVCSLLSDKPTNITFDGTVSRDISAFFNCLTALGAEIIWTESLIRVIPPKVFPESAQANCLSSGAALRFFLPLFTALCSDARLVFSKSLASRPIDPLINTLRENGAIITKAPFHENHLFPVSDSEEMCTLEITRGISSSDFNICGNVSSQFISGLLFASTVNGGRIRVAGKTESRDYILLTLDVLRRFGGKVCETENGFVCEKIFPLVSPEHSVAEGDWSNAAFALVGGAVGDNPVSVCNLSANSVQGDRRILDILSRMGAKIEVRENTVTVFPSTLKGFVIDGKNIPDIVLPLCVAGICAEGTTVIQNISRLKYKETDRINSALELFTELGGDISHNDNAIILNHGKLHGGKVEGKNDHRTVMTAALCSLVCSGEITVSDEKAVEKSFPKFFEQFETNME